MNLIEWQSLSSLFKSAGNKMPPLLINSALPNSADGDLTNKGVHPFFKFSSAPVQVPPEPKVDATTTAFVDKIYILFIPCHCFADKKTRFWAKRRKEQDFSPLNSFSEILF